MIPPRVVSNNELSRGRSRGQDGGGMSRSALGRGLGSLLSEREGRGVPVSASGVGRLRRPESAWTGVKGQSGEDATRPSASSPGGVRPNLRRWIRWVLGVADLVLVGLGFWLGLISPLAGEVTALAAAGVMVGIGALLGGLAVAGGIASADD